MAKLYRSCFFILISLLPLGTVGQHFGDEWIVPGQPYYKIKIAQEGFYKLSYEVLQRYLPSQNIPKDKLTLWHRGIQQSIAIQAKGDFLQAGDYVLFYGIKNNGEQDSLLYRPATNLYNPHYNLFSDTTAYFLTFSETGPWKRMDTLRVSHLDSSSSSTIRTQHLQVYAKEFWQTGNEGQDPLQVHFEPGEGWYNIEYPDESIQKIPALHYTPDADSTVFEIYSASITRGTYSPRFYLLNSTGTDSLFLGEVADLSNRSFGAVKARFALAKDLRPYLDNGHFNLLVSFKGKGQLTIAYVEARIPQLPILSMDTKSNAFFTTASTPSCVIPTGSQPWFAWISNRNNVALIQDSVVGGRSYLPAIGAGEKIFYTYRLDSVRAVEPVVFRTYQTSDSLYVVLSCDSLWSAATAYASYRKSPAGGAYDTLVVNAKDLMNQFGYGEETPLAIRRFLNRLKSLRPQAPDHLFIIGMGFTLEQRFYPFSEEVVRSYRQHNYVIPAGVPGGDYGYSIGLDGTAGSIPMYGFQQYYSTVPTGRLSAKKEQAVWDYLAKVKEHEALPSEQPWRKNVLHLSGGYQSWGSDAYNREQSKMFRTILDGFTNLIQLPYLGANVTSFSRSTTQSAEIINVSEQVNRGVSLITFFGHSSPNVTDITIGYVSEGLNTYGYANKGKYPMIYLNGCQTGNAFFDQDLVPASFRSLVSDWVLTKDRGAIVGLANTSTGFVQYLKLGIENMYISSFLDSTNISRTIGEQTVIAQKRYIHTYTDPQQPSEHGTSMIGTTTLQGDPAVRLHPSPKADYAIECEKVQLRSYNRRKITTETDSFEVLIPVRNLGVYTKQPFSVSIKRTFANNTKSILYDPQTYFPVRNLDTLHFIIRGAIPQSAGTNLFEIIVDPLGKVPESSKGNNACTYASYLPGTTMLCLSPKKFSIVGKQPVTFVAQSTTITVKERSFYFELDTTYLFNSPFKRSFSATSFNLPQWENQPLLPAQATGDTIVYFWRVKYVQPEASEDTAYTYSSFTYIPDSPEGWSQRKPAQFFENETMAIRMDTSTGKWTFTKVLGQLKVTTAGKDAAGGTATSFMSFRGVPQVFGNNCAHPDPSQGANGFYLMAISPVDLSTRVTKRTHPGDDAYYQCNAFNSPFVTRFLLLNPTYPWQFDYLYQTLKDTIREGEIALMMSIGDAGFGYFPDSLKKILKDSFGASKHLDSLQNGHPYVLLARKGMGKIAERYPTSHDTLRTREVLQLDTVLSSLGYAGFLSSPLIGPSTAWGMFNFRHDKQPSDSLRLSIAGIDSLGKETTLVTDVKTNALDLASIVAPSNYPFVRLHAYKATTTLSTPQLLSWQVLFKGSPEGTLVINEGSEQEYGSFVLPEGDTSKLLRFRFRNISSETFAAGLVVRYKISNGERSLLKFDTLKSTLRPDSLWTASFRVPTMGFAGDNTLEVFFNPEGRQKEEFLENNRYTIPYKVTPIRSQSIIEVAFDGQRIINRDIVAPSPLIHIAVHDESDYLTRKDTSGMLVELQRPCGQAACPFERIHLGSKEIQFHPATPNTKKFVLLYKPEKLGDGLYTLRVSAKELAGNTIGKPFTIQFEVVNEMAITNFLPYPNPFSSKMWFVYTLTGDVPDQIRIQIMTITGKIVKQIFQDELGPLRIGTHKTEFVWDGTDDYGDQLANGVYLYKINVRKEGEELKKRETVNDNLFQNGFGKLYILR